MYQSDYSANPNYSNSADYLYIFFKYVPIYKSIINSSNPTQSLSENISQCSGNKIFIKNDSDVNITNIEEYVPYKKKEVIKLFTLLKNNLDIY